MMPRSNPAPLSSFFLVKILAGEREGAAGPLATPPATGRIA